MKLFEIIVIGIGLAMDAFAVSVCKGLAMKKLDCKKAIIIAVYFGIFQTLMPVLGYFLGSTLSSFVQQVDHWIAFILLVLIGGNMIKDSTDDEEEKRNDRVDVKTMVLLAIATSIDALAVGVTFAFFEVNLFWKFDLNTKRFSIIQGTLLHREGFTQQFKPKIIIETVLLNITK